MYIFVVVQLLSHVQIFVTPWTAARQAPLSSTVSWSLLEFMSVESVAILSSAIPFSFYLQSSPASGSFPISQLFVSGAKVFSFSISPSSEFKGQLPLGKIGLISLETKGVSRVFSSSTIQKQRFFSSQPSLWFSSHIRT